MALPAHIQTRLPAVVAACTEAGVLRLWIFGSAATEQWNEESSDVDFLVELDRSRPLADQFLGLYRSLTEIFARRIDLVSVEGVRNQYFKLELERTRVPVYAAA